MRFNPYIVAAMVLYLPAAMAANEPVAGAIVRKDPTKTPKAEFSPGNMTDIMPQQQTFVTRPRKFWQFHTRDIR